MGRSYTNIHGRKAGRGIRPWLLLPKVIAVGLYLGALASTLVVWFSSDYLATDAGDPQRLAVLQTIRRLMLVLAVPALLTAMGFGVALLLQHPRQLLRLRWVRVKLATLAVLVPTAHWFLSSRLAMLREAYPAEQAPPAAQQLTWGLVLTLITSVSVIILGRLKPRLGQNWAVDFARFRNERVSEAP
jgi:uncharacterized membrane protein